jgi:hypothetical protein
MKWRVWVALYNLKLQIFSEATNTTKFFESQVLLKDRIQWASDVLNTLTTSEADEKLCKYLSNLSGRKVSFLHGEYFCIECV